MNRSHVLPAKLDNGEPDRITLKSQIAFTLNILKGPLVVIMIVALVVSAIGIMMFDNYTISRYERSETTRLDAFAVAVSKHVEQSVKRGDDLLKQIRLAYLSDPASVRPLLVAHNKIVDRDTFPLEAVISADGIIFLSTTSGTEITSERLDLSDREHFRVHKDAIDPLQDDIFFGKVIVGRVSKLPVMQITRAIRSPKGELLAVGVVSINPLTFVDAYKKITDAGTTISILGDDGFSRIRVAGNTINYSQDFRGSPIYVDVMRRRNGVIQTDSVVDGVHRIFSYRSVSGMPLTAVVAASYDSGQQGIFRVDSDEKWRELYIGAAIVGAMAILLFFAVWSRVLELRLLKSHGALAETIRDMSLVQAAQREFVASVSHELRTPLHGVLGHSQLLSMGLPAGPMRESAQAIFTSATDMRTMISQLLDLARVEAGKEFLEFQRVDVASLVKEVCVLHRQTWQRAGVAFIMDLKDCEGVSIRTDALALKRCMHNLISNAGKFTLQGEIVVRCTPVDGGGVSISVKDTGVGIAPENIERIFDHYSYLSRSAKSNVAGTGLGLSLCRSLVQLLSGTIAVESELGKGSTFTITLPSSPASNASAAVDSKATIPNEDIDR